MHDADLERARAALSYLSPDCDRATWAKYGMCLKNEFGDAGFEVWDSWSALSDKYSASGAKSTWKSIKAAGKTGLGSLIYDAKQAGWKDDSKVKKPTAAEIAARKAAAEERARKAAEEDAERHAAAAARAQALWDAAAPLDGDGHPYLERKGVLSYGLRVGRWERLDEQTGEWVTTTQKGLLIPLRDRTRKLWSLQCIYPDASGKKLYLKDGAKHGHFHAIGSMVKREDRALFVLAEGYATGASVHAATGYMVLVCFDASNLAAVARAIRERSQDAIILFAADNDTQTEGNPGVTLANKAAKEVGGLVAVPPPGDFNDLQVADGLEAVAGVIDAALSAPVAEPDPEPEPEPEPEPAAAELPPAFEQPPLPPEIEDGEIAIPTFGHFTVLGYDGDEFWAFHHAKRQVVSRTRSHFASDQGLIDLAPMNWWEEYFPGSGKTTVDRNLAYEWFVRVAHRRGVYDPSRIRGRGAWRDKGRVVFHHGSHLTVDGARTEIAKIESGWVYPMAQSLQEPSPTPLSDEEGKRLLDIAAMARWARPGSAALLAGWVFLSPICGALPWRPHIWLTGKSGSGKSSIQERYVQALLAGICEHFQGDSTEAGIRQVLKADAVPALIDEFEPNDEADRKRMKNVLTMMRQASSETSAQTVKGTISGDGVRYHIRSMFCLASVNTMLDKDSDQTRITTLVLRPPVQIAKGASDPQWEKLDEALHGIEVDGGCSARLLARALWLLPTVIANVEVFRRAAAKRFGTQRLGDQFGTLLAGAWCLQRAALATDAQALAMIDGYDWTDHQDVSGGMGDPEKALASIMESKIRVGTVDVTIFELLSEACGRPASQTAIGEGVCVDILRRNGIIIDGKRILFGVSSNNLRSLVKDTPYSTDLRGQLSRLPGATNNDNKTRSFLGVVSKVITVPMSLVLDDEESPL